MSLTSRGFISEFLVSFGGLPRIKATFINGACADMPNALSDVWMGCPTQNTKGWLQTAETINLSSTSAVDSIASTGARQVLLQGVDNDFNEITELVDMAGLGTVTTSQSFLRVNFADVVTSGTYGPAGTGANEGVITLESSSTNNLEGIISFVGGVPMGQMANTHYTVPAGKLGVIRNNIDISVDRQMSANAYLMVRFNALGVDAAPFGATRVIGVMTCNAGLTNVSVNTPPALPEKADIWFAALPAQNLTPIQINYNIAVGSP